MIDSDFSGCKVTNFFEKSQREFFCSFCIIAPFRPFSVKLYKIMTETDGTDMKKSMNLPQSKNFSET